MGHLKIDGHELDVNELYSWVGGMITLQRKGKLRKVKIHSQLEHIFKDFDNRKKEAAYETKDTVEHKDPSSIKNSDKELAMSIIEFLQNNPDYMDEFITIVKEGIAELALEKL